MDDSNTAIYDLKKIVSNFCEDRNWKQYHNPKDLSILISVEASELLEIFRFKSEKDIEEIMNIKKEKIEDEIADILFGILRFSELYDIDLSQSLKNKIVKNNSKYPIDKSFGSNKKYTEIQ